MYLMPQVDGIDHVSTMVAQSCSLFKIKLNIAYKMRVSQDKAQT